MKTKIISLTLTLIMVFTTVVTSYASTTAEVNPTTSSTLYETFKKAGLDVSKISKNKDGETFDVLLGDVQSTMTEKNLIDGSIQLNINENNKEDIIILDVDGHINVNGENLVVKTIERDENGNILNEIERDTFNTLNTLRSVPQWSYSDDPFGGTSRYDYTKLYKTREHTIKYSSFVVSTSAGTIVSCIFAGLSIIKTAGLALLVAVVTEVAQQIKQAASPYELQSDVIETLWRIPGDMEIRYKHGVDYYNTKGKYVDSSIHYSYHI